MKRPIGVILAAIVLSLFALVQLFTAGIMTIGGIAMGHADPSKMPPAMPGPMLGWMHAFVIACALFIAGLATWAVFTVVGILRLRNWARISILVIGGCLAGLGLMCLFGLAMTWGALHTMPVTQPHGDPFILRITLIVTGIMYGLVLAIGVWWLVYFNLRSVKAAFAAPILQPDGTYLHANPTPSAPGYFPPAPTAITILGWLWIISSVFCLLMVLVPLPGFFLGLFLTGIGKDALYIAFSALAAYAGWGTLHLRESGRRVAIGFVCLGLVQMPLILTPWFQHRQQAYTAAVLQSMSLPNQQLTVAPTDSTFYLGNTHIAFTVIMVTFALAFYLVQLWLLHRHRNAFRPSPFIATHPAP